MLNYYFIFLCYQQSRQDYYPHFPYFSLSRSHKQRQRQLTAATKAANSSIYITNVNIYISSCRVHVTKEKDKTKWRRLLFFGPHPWPVLFSFYTWPAPPNNQILYMGDPFK